MSKLSPVSQYVATAGINVNPMSQKHLLKYAKKKPEKKIEKSADSSDDDADYSKFQSKKTIEEAKQRREKELAELK